MWRLTSDDHTDLSSQTTCDTRSWRMLSSWFSHSLSCCWVFHASAVFIVSVYFQIYSVCVSSNSNSINTFCFLKLSSKMKILSNVSIYTREMCFLLHWILTLYDKSGCQFKSSNKEKVLQRLRILEPLPDVSLWSSLVCVFIPKHTYPLSSVDVFSSCYHTLSLCQHINTNVTLIGWFKRRVYKYTMLIGWTVKLRIDALSLVHYLVTWISHDFLSCAPRMEQRPRPPWQYPCVLLLTLLSSCFGIC